MPSPHESDYTHYRSYLLASLVAFLAEHRRCGELESGGDGERVWMTCTCGAAISRSLEPAPRQLFQIC